MANIYTNQLSQSILFNQQLVKATVRGLPTSQIWRLNISRWILASTTKYFNTIASNNSLHFYIEGTIRKTEEQQKYIEFRLDGPDFNQLSKDYYRLNVEINILWSFNQDDVDFHEPARIKGIIIDAMTAICIYKYGDGAYDDGSFVGTLRLRHEPIRVNNFGQIQSGIRLIQGTVEGSYSMLHTITD